MRSIRIIPKLDIKGPNLVKGINLEGLRALGSPRNFIEYYYKNGADELICHDVVASLYLRNNLDSIIKETSKNIFLPIIVGGGIRNINDIQRLLKSGADRIFLNTAAVKKPSLIKKASKYFGSSTILVSIESIEREKEHFCLIDFGRQLTKIKVIDWIDVIQSNGAGEIIITSVNKEGTGTGFDLKLFEKISKKIKIPFIVNGGFGKLSHIKDLLNYCCPSGIAIGSALHYSSMMNIKKKEDLDEGNFEFIRNSKNFLNFKKINIKNIKNYTNSLIKK
jgi:cyclase